MLGLVVDVEDEDVCAPHAAKATSTVIERMVFFMVVSLSWGDCSVAPACGMAGVQRGLPFSPIADSTILRA